MSRRRNQARNDQFLFEELARSHPLTPQPPAQASQRRAKPRPSLNPCGIEGCRLRRYKCERQLREGTHRVQQPVDTAQAAVDELLPPNFCGDPRCLVHPKVCYELHVPPSRVPRHRCPTGWCERSELHCESAFIIEARRGQSA